MLSLLLLVLMFLGSAQSQSLDVSSADSIKKAAKDYAGRVVSYYHGNEAGNTPGLLPMPYFWWEAGGMFDLLIDYWHYTGDNQYNDLISQGLLFQKGQDNNFTPSNQTKNLGNSDQVFWALAAMSAAESNFAQPTAGDPSWITLADAVFQSQVERWDSETCAGGLRWQVFSFNSGYNYKNSESNGGFFQLASRLTRYNTKNTTYAEWAEKAFDWSISIGLIDSEWNVYDGTDITVNCTNINHIQWSYLAAMYTAGAAHMYNATSGAAKWKTALDGLLNRTLNIYFPSGDIMVEVACETVGSCNVDQQSFKSYTARWLADTIQMAPYTAPLIQPKLRASAEAAVKKCTEKECALTWTDDKNPMKVALDGLGPTMNALAIIQALLVENSAAAVTVGTGGSAAGNSSSTPTSPTASASGSGAVASGSGAAGVAATTATSRPSSASVASLGFAWLCFSSVLVGFTAFLAL